MVLTSLCAATSALSYLDGDGHRPLLQLYHADLYATINVIDDTAPSLPSITCPEDITLYADDQATLIPTRPSRAWPRL